MVTAPFLKIEHERVVFLRMRAIEARQCLNRLYTRERLVHVHRVEQRLVIASLKLVRANEEPVRMRLNPVGDVARGKAIERGFRYATREDELDQLLRGKRFVDLFAVVRQGLRASVESYSIKRLEPLYGYVREASLPDANQALAQVHALLELGDASDIGDDERRVVEAYNHDDCRSTWRLRDWLENVRASAISDGEIIERPALSDAEPVKPSANGS